MTFDVEEGFYFFEIVVDGIVTYFPTGARLRRVPT